MKEEEEDVTQETNVQRQNGSVREEDVTRKMSVRRQEELVQEADVLQEEFRQKYRVREEMRILWRELQKEEKLGVSDIKLTNKEEDKKVIEYIQSHKTKDAYAFSRNEISNATGIPLNTLSYTTMIKIPNVRFILLNGKLWFTTVTMKERLTEILKN